MTFKQIRKELIKANDALPIKWVMSGIVEIASLEPNGAVRITNLISKYSYILPKYKKSDDHKFEILTDELVALGSLFPKSFPKK